MITVERGCFDIVVGEEGEENTFNTRGKLSEVDERIVKGLVVLVIEFMDE